MSNFTIEHVRESTMNLVGKNLFFDKDINVLFWTDVLAGQIFKLDLNNQMINACRILGEKTISFVVPIKGKRDQFIIGAGKRLLQITWDGQQTMGQIQKVLGEIQTNGARINEVSVDKQGRLFFGTMINEEQGDVMDHNKRLGGLYRFTMNEGIVLLKDNIGMGNGMVWNNQFNKMFFVDSFDNNVYEFDYDLKTGNIRELI
jgi:gluconolactonase